MSSARGAQAASPKTDIHGRLNAESHGRDIQSALTRLRDLLHWAPNNVVGAIILALAAIIALLVHSAVSRLVRRIVDARGIPISPASSPAPGISPSSRS